VTSGRTRQTAPPSHPALSSKGFWSASLNGSTPDTYVGVYFSDGHTSWASPEVLYYVRCVR